jgi:hypothetical protein
MGRQSFARVKWGRQVITNVDFVASNCTFVEYLAVHH